jgi:folate-binding protein YgfZ
LQSRTSIKADQTQLSALDTSCGLIEWNGFTIVEHSGADALDLLNRLTTRELLSVEVGHSRRSVLTSDRGRVVDAFLVAHVDENKLLLVSDSPNSERLISAIDYYTIIEDAELEDKSESMSRISLVGPTSSDVIESTFGVTLDSDTTSTIAFDGESVILISDTSRGVEWIDVISSSSPAETISNALSQNGAISVDQENFEHFRISNAIPGSDKEYGEHSNPIEAGLLHLIDWDKGCYVGQEVIARLDAYDKVQRNLKILRSDSPLVPSSKLTSGSKPVGLLTSASSLETDNGEFLSLALVRKAFLETATELDADGVTATVS